jgi:hypothetical protein
VGERCIQGFGGKPEGKRLFGKPRSRYEGKNKVDLIGRKEDVDWIDLAQDRDRWQAVVIAVMNLRVS